ncbi:transcriptional regulator (plasmid) [Saccharobesus litoralis]|uniref:Transcriptional regulator n=1 Tax=Saccharobesus litoralis TaxID=2172099 RepID=A0A2S0VY96_9ALTE|nr:type II toxin-antitoxin system antitoxin HipB [Saccharobesus litoralis]AWB69196.1 transcriptional regulator [Saccharobesus litoralis]
MIIYSAKQLSAYLRDERKGQSLTQQEVAKQVGIKQNTVSNFENNPDDCTVKTLFKLLSSLELELNVSPKNTDKSTQEWSEEW